MTFTMKIRKQHREIGKQVHDEEQQYNIRMYDIFLPRECMAGIRASVRHRLHIVT
jgi:hypothetical protein